MGWQHVLNYFMLEDLANYFFLGRHSRERLNMGVSRHHGLGHVRQANPMQSIEAVKTWIAQRPRCILINVDLIFENRILSLLCILYVPGIWGAGKVEARRWMPFIQRRRNYRSVTYPQNSHVKVPLPHTNYIFGRENEGLIFQRAPRLTDATA